jgi:hypothetical protein
LEGVTKIKRALNKILDNHARAIPETVLLIE